MTKKQVIYKMNQANDCGITEHPQKQMRLLGYKVIAAVAQSLGDCWWFTVEDYIEPFPPYIAKMEYDFDYWHGYGKMVVT